MHYRLILLLLIFSALDSRSAVAEATSEQDVVVGASQFLDRYKDALERVKNAEHHQTIKVRLTNHSSNAAFDIEKAPLPDSVKSSYLNYDFLNKDNQSKLHIFYESPNFFDRVLIKTVDSDFVLTKKDLASSYYLEFKEWGSVFRDTRRSFDLIVRGTPYTVGTHSIMEMIDSGKFVVTGLEEDILSLGRYLKVSFFHNPVSPGAGSADIPEKRKSLPIKQNLTQIKGWLRLEPEKLYAIVEYNLSVEYRPEVKASFKLSGSNKYLEENGLPYLKNSSKIETYIDEMNNVKSMRWAQIDVQKWNYIDSDDSMITLADYGLAPAKTQGPSLSMHPALLLLPLGILLLMIGIFLKRKGSA